MSAPPLTGAQLAALLDVTEARVSQMRSEDDAPPIDPIDDGYDVRELGAWLRRRWGVDGSAAITTALLKREKIREEVEHRRIANAKSRGELISASAHADYCADIAARVRVALLSVGRKVAPEVVMADSIETAEGIVLRAVREALEELRRLDASELVKPEAVERSRGLETRSDVKESPELLAPPALDTMPPAKRRGRPRNARQ